MRLGKEREILGKNRTVGSLSYCPSACLCDWGNIVWGYCLSKMHNLKVKNYMLLGRQTEDSSPESSISDSSKSLLQRGMGGARMHRGFLQQRPGGQNMKRLLLVRENQTSWVGEFCVFLCMERWKGLGSLKPLLPYVPLSSLGPLFCAFLSGVSSGARRGGCRVWFDGGHYVSMPSPLRAHCWHRWNMMAWRLPHPMFTNMAGSISFIDTHNLRKRSLKKLAGCGNTRTHWKWSASVSHSVASDSLWPRVRLLCLWDSLGKHTGVGYHFLLQGIFPPQGLNLGLLHCRQSHQGSPHTGTFKTEVQ